jgi:hypothetical protein
LVCEKVGVAPVDKSRLLEEAVKHLSQEWGFWSKSRNNGYF